MLVAKTRRDARAGNECSEMDAASRCGGDTGLAPNAVSSSGHGGFSPTDEAQRPTLESLAPPICCARSFLDLGFTIYDLGAGERTTGAMKARTKGEVNERRD